MPAELTLLVLAWLGTYLVHSTVLLGAAWLVTRARKLRDPRLAEKVWRAALVGSVLTASVQLGLGYEPVLGRLTLDTPVATADEPMPTPDDRADDEIERARDAAQVADAMRDGRGVEPAQRDDSVRAGARPEVLRPEDRPDLTLPTRPYSPAPRSETELVNVAVLESEPARGGAADGDPSALDGRVEHLARLGERTHRPGSSGSSGSTGLDDATGDRVASGDEPATLAGTLSAFDRLARLASSDVARWTAWCKSGLVWLWVLVGGLGALGFTWAASRLLVRMADRREIVSGAPYTLFDRLRERAGLAGRVRLFASPTIASPMTYGWLRRKVCVPMRALVELSPPQLESLLAHELAHAKRRDPLWFGVYTLAERLLFFQPLNRLARRELHDVAELLCDDWAVRWTGSRLALASCLTEVAQWLVGRRRLALSLPGMADGHPSRLGVRVGRLLEEDEEPAPESRHRWMPPVASATLSLVVLAAPGVSSPRTASAPVAAVPSSAPAPTAVALAPPAPDVVPSVDVEERALEPRRSRALTLALELLDAEIDGLQAELEATRAELDGTPYAGRFDGAFARVEARIRTLREKRERLAALVVLASNPVPPAHQPDGVARDRAQR